MTPNKTDQSAARDTPRDRASALFLRHIHYVEAVAFRVAPFPVVQDDIVQDAFIDFVEKADQWDLEKDVRPLLYSITANIGKQYYREHLKSCPDRIQRIFEFGLIPIANEADDEHIDNLDDQMEALRICMRKLTPTCRMLLHLYYYLGKSYHEISEETGKSEGTLQKAISRVRDTLYDCVHRILAVEERNTPW